MLYRILGARTTKVVVWVAIAVGALWAVPFAMGRLEEIAIIYNRQTFDWQLLWTALGALVLTMILAAIGVGLFGMFWAIVVRMGGWALYRKEIREVKADMDVMKEDIAAIKRRLGINEDDAE